MQRALWRAFSLQGCFPCALARRRSADSRSRSPRAAKGPLAGALCRALEVLGPHISQGPGRRWERRGQNSKIIIRILGVQASTAPAHIACRVVIRSNPPLRNYTAPWGGILLLVWAVVNPGAIAKQGT